MNGIAPTSKANSDVASGCISCNILSFTPLCRCRRAATSVNHIANSQLVLPLLQWMHSRALACMKSGESRITRILKEYLMQLFAAAVCRFRAQELRDNCLCFSADASVMCFNTLTNMK